MMIISGLVAIKQLPELVEKWGTDKILKIQTSNEFITNTNPAFVVLTIDSDEFIEKYIGAKHLAD